MLHDDMLARAGEMTIDEAGNRRSEPREAVPTEVLLLWHHSPEEPVRYVSRDSSEHGMRIRSSVPLMEGMSGVILRFLPEGTPVDRAVMVVWCRSCERSGSFEAGLRMF